MIQALARSAVQVQRRLDEAYEGDLQRFAPASLALTQALGDGARALAPAREVARSVRLEASAVLSVERSRGFRVGATVVNVGYQARFGSAEAYGSRLRVEIEQAPVADHP
ncbi:MAG: hypothetical protein AAF682_14565 [Planctomycetota bacterium]